MTQTGLVLGTPNYMSPEQAQARPFDGRSDQFSLAVLAYRILAGKLPFDAPSITAVLSKLLWEQPEFAETDLAPTIRTVLAKALAKDPTQRYGSCVEFVTTLEKAYDACRPEIPVFDGPAVADQPADPPAAPGPEPVTRPVPAPIEAQETASVSVPFFARGEETTTHPGIRVTGPEASAHLPPPVGGEEAQSSRSSGRPGAKWVGLLLAAVVVALFLAGYALFWRRSSPAAPDAPLKAAIPEPAAEPVTVPATMPPPETMPAVTPKPSAEKKMPKPAASRAIRPKDPAPAQVRTAAAEKSAEVPVTPKPQEPATGTITWNGRMAKNAILVISNSGASFGVAAGAFPGIPIKVEVEPATVQIRAMPGAENGWKQIMLYSASERFSKIVIRWTALK
jgi:serine/threonine-protein kinase